jgi:beta-N-acetylhexosaminidase
MRNKITVVIIVIFVMVTASIFGLNIYKGTIVAEHNHLLKLLSDNNEAQYSVEINPQVIWSQIELLNHDNKNFRTRIIEQYNSSIDQIQQLSSDISQLLKQAAALKINVNRNFEDGVQQFVKLDSYDESIITRAQDRFTYLVNYKSYLRSLFSEYQSLQSKAGKFSNPLWGYSDTDIQQLMGSMTNEEKAGQLLMFSFDGYGLNEKQLARYMELSPGGLIIMSANVSHAAQVKNLTKQIQGLNPRIPMFIATDQEGGVVKRISWDNTSGQKLWAGMSDAELCQLGQQRSALLLDLGINMNFSPVVDLSYSGTAYINNRAISGDSQVVTAKSKAYITCSQGQGIISTLKHFPGHGPTILDSHLHLPVVAKSRVDWLASDAVPFKENLQVKQIMISHLLYSNIDKENPTTLSPVFLTEILRREWGYQGLIVTDDMNMLHSSTKISVRDALRRTINAGSDLVLYVGAPMSFEDVKAQLVDLIAKGEISNERLSQSLFRILITKREFNY